MALTVVRTIIGVFIFFSNRLFKRRRVFNLRLVNSGLGDTRSYGRQSQAGNSSTVMFEPNAFRVSKAIESFLSSRVIYITERSGKDEAILLIANMSTPPGVPVIFIREKFWNRELFIFNGLKVCS